MYATHSSIWEISTRSSCDSIYMCICMHITVLQSCKVQHGECMVPNAGLCGHCNHYVVYYQPCDFLILYCGQTACNTKCIYDVYRYRIGFMQIRSLAMDNIHSYYCTHSYNHAIVRTMHLYNYYTQLVIQ